MTCELCHERPATVVASDEPDNFGALVMGDEVLGVMLCPFCLAQTVDYGGPWSAVEPLDDSPTG